MDREAWYTAETVDLAADALREECLLPDKTARRVLSVIEDEVEAYVQERIQYARGDGR